MRHGTNIGRSIVITRLATPARWRVRLDKFAASATAESRKAREAAAPELNKAWSKTRDAATTLETASAADWRSAKSSFKKSFEDLATVWSKAVAETK